MTERDHRVEIVSSLLTTPHGELDGLWKRHQVWLGEDPHFYTHLAAWYMDNGEVRDHKELFISTLCLAERIEHREVGGVMLMGLAPHEVSHCVSIVKEVAGRNVPRTMKKRIVGYLKEREEDPVRFERSVMFARGEMKRLYASLRIPTGGLAQRLLFGKPPKGSVLGVLASLGGVKSAAEQRPILMELIEKHRPPYVVISTLVLKELWSDEGVAEALVGLMSPSQVVNHLGMLSGRGLFGKPRVAQKIREKIEEAKTNKRFSTMKAEKAIKALEGVGESALAEEWKVLLHGVTNKRLEKKASIHRDIAMFVDKSSSMERAIELAKEIGSAVAPLCRGGLSVVAFDTIPVPVAAPMSGDIGVWQQAFRDIHATGATSIGAPLAWLLRQKLRVEQIILISDGEENSRPRFWPQMRKYESEFGPVDVVWIQVGKDSKASQKWGKEGEEVQQGEFTVLDARGTDYFALPNLLSLLGGPSWFDMVLDISEYPLPSESSPPMM